jgi:hypothetical protein
LAGEPASGKIASMRARESAAEYVVKNGKRKAVILPIEEKNCSKTCMIWASSPVAGMNPRFRSKMFCAG